MVRVIEGVCRERGEGDLAPSPFRLDRDLTALEKAIREMGNCRLVILDPQDAFLGRIDSHKNAEVRSILADLAARTGVAVVGVSLASISHHFPMTMAKSMTFCYRPIMFNSRLIRHSIATSP